MQAVVWKDSDIKTFADLKGKKISPGSAGSGDLLQYEAILKFYGMEIKDVDWRPLTHTERVTGMQDKQLDMAGYATAWPAGSIIELSSARPVRILGFKDPAKDIPEFLKLYPAYGTENLPAGTYNGVDEPVQLITTGSIFAALPELSADYVYNMLDCMTKGIDEVQAYVRIITPKIIGMVFISVPLLITEYVIDVPSGVILTIMFPVIIFFLILIGRQARDRAERQYVSYTRMTNRFMDTLRGLPVIQSFGAVAKETDAVYANSENVRTATVRTLRTATLSSAVLDFCATFGVAAVAIMLAFRLMDGSLVLYTGLLALIIAPEYFTPIRSFASDYHASLDGKNSLAAVLALCEEANDVAPSSDSTTFPGFTQTRKSLNSRVLQTSTNTAATKNFTRRPNSSGIWSSTIIRGSTAGTVRASISSRPTNSRNALRSMPVQSPATLLI